MSLLSSLTISLTGTSSSCMRERSRVSSSSLSLKALRLTAPDEPDPEPVVFTGDIFRLAKDKDLWENVLMDFLWTIPAESLRTTTTTIWGRTEEAMSEQRERVGAACQKE